MKIPDLSRTVIVGSSCSGKSTLARTLSRILDQVHIELDELYWDKNWKPRSSEDFRERVSGALPSDRWIVDGNYRVVRDMIWPHATVLIWLNLPLSTVLARGIKRALAHGFSGRVTCGGNHESLYRTFCSSDSILLWILSTFHRRRKDIAHIRDTGQYPALHIVELHSPAEMELFLHTVKNAV